MLCLNVTALLLLVLAGFSFQLEDDKATCEEFCAESTCESLDCDEDEILIKADETECRCCDQCLPKNCNCDRIQCDPPVCEDGTELVTMDKNDAPTCLCCPFCASTENKCANVTCIAADKITCPLTTKLENPDLENGRCCASCA